MLIKKYPLIKSRGNVFYDNNFSPLKLIPIAPRGAVRTIDKTAMDKIRSPDSTHKDKGMAPIAACTVAFGI